MPPTLENPSTDSPSQNSGGLVGFLRQHLGVPIGHALARLGTGLQAAGPQLEQISAILAQTAGNNAPMQALLEKRQMEQRDKQWAADDELRQLQAQRARLEIQNYQNPQQRQDLELAGLRKQLELKRQFENPEPIPLTDKAGNISYVVRDANGIFKPAQMETQETISPPSRVQVPFSPDATVTRPVLSPLASQAKQPAPNTDFDKLYRMKVAAGLQDTPENYKSAYDEWKRTDPAFQAAQTNRQTAHDQQLSNDAEKSYQFHVGMLNKVRTPVEQQLDRLSRLSDTLG